MSHYILSLEHIQSNSKESEDSHGQRHATAWAVGCCGSLITGVFNLIVLLCSIYEKQLFGFFLQLEPKIYLTAIISANTII
jgi:hypothetical protein